MEPETFIETAFRLDEEVVDTIQKQVGDMNKYELDTCMQGIRNRQIPGLKGFLKTSYIEGNQLEIDRWQEIAQIHAKDAVCKKAARTIINDLNRSRMKERYHL